MKQQQHQYEVKPKILYFDQFQYFQQMQNLIKIILLSESLNIFKIQTKVSKIMNPSQMDDLQAFLIEAQLVNQKVKALAQDKITIQEFDLMEKKKNQQIIKKEEKKRQKEIELQQEKIKGRAGKGITKDFVSFCRSCHQQYQLETLQCLKCGKKTMTLEERQKQLTQMVEVYKQKKARKQTRRQKWDMWKKTQSMLPSKLATQYTKWQAYTSSEEQPQNQQPIVPKDDPNFRALEMDLEERKKRKQLSDAKANGYKQKGNKLMTEKKYQQAADCYTLALEESRDNKLLYTNRALAYIKLRRWHRAIKDCSTVIEYMECFQKLQQTPDLAFKAFSRRALSHKQRKQYSKALEDIDNALKYNSKDQSAIRLRSQILNFIKYQKQSTQLLKQNSVNAGNEGDDQQKDKDQKQYSDKDIIKQLAEQQIQTQKRQKQSSVQQSKSNTQPIAKNNPLPKQSIDKIKYYLQNISSDSIQNILKILTSQPNLKPAFIKIQGVKKLLNYIQNEEHKGKSIILLCYLMDGSGITEQEVWDYNPHKFQQKCVSLLQSQLKTDSYSQLQDYFQIFVALSLNEKYRLLLSQSEQTINFIQFCYPILITKFKKEPQVLNSYIVYFSNLCKGQTKLKKNISINIKTILETLERILGIQTKNKKIHELQKSIYILLANLATCQEIRNQIIQNDGLLQKSANHLKTFSKSSDYYEPFVEADLSLFVNILYQSNENILGKISKLSLENILYDRFINVMPNSNTHSEIFIRALNIFSKLDFKNKDVNKKWISKMESLFRQENILKGITNHALRFYNNIYLSHKQLDLPNKIQPIADLLNQQNQILFCNSCNLLGIWADNPKLSPRTYTSLKPYIIKLINVAKEKTGNMRKSSAILLAKIARDQGSKEIFLANHGMQVIKSIANFVLDKK